MAPVQALVLKVVTFITGGKSRGSEEWNMSMYIIRVLSTRIHVEDMDDFACTVTGTPSSRCRCY